jgi:hypothetical protein
MKKIILSLFLVSDLTAAMKVDTAIMKVDKETYHLFGNVILYWDVYHVEAEEPFPTTREELESILLRRLFTGRIFSPEDQQKILTHSDFLLKKLQDRRKSQERNRRKEERKRALYEQTPAGRLAKEAEERRIEQRDAPLRAIQKHNEERRQKGLLETQSIVETQPDNVSVKKMRELQRLLEEKHKKPLTLDQQLSLYHLCHEKGQSTLDTELTTWLKEFLETYAQPMEEMIEKESDHLFIPWDLWMYYPYGRESRHG